MLDARRHCLAREGWGIVRDASGLLAGGCGVSLFGRLLLVLDEAGASEQVFSILPFVPGCWVLPCSIWILCHCGGLLLE